MKPFFTFIMAFALLFAFSGCSSHPKAPLSQSRLVIVLGDDVSLSVTGYRSLDTSFIMSCIEALSVSGGELVFFTVGDPNDRSGIRCAIEPIPAIDNSTTMSTRLGQKRIAEDIRQLNMKSIQRFLTEVEAEYLLAKGPLSKGSQQTDIEQFLAKAERLLNETGYRDHTKYLFLYSDGIQSTRGRDRPARYPLKVEGDFTLCLSGWKHPNPSDSVRILHFESPDGFIRQIKYNNK